MYSICLCKICATGGDPVCNDNSVEGLTNLTCSIEFRGNWAPTMEWKEHMSDGEIILSMGVNTVTVPNGRVTSSLVMGVQRGRRNFACTTKFDISGKPVRTTATNVPDYFRVWTASVLPTTEGLFGQNSETKFVLLKRESSSDSLPSRQVQMSDVATPLVVGLLPSAFSFQSIIQSRI